MSVYKHSPGLADIVKGIRAYRFFVQNFMVLEWHATPSRDFSQIRGVSTIYSANHIIHNFELIYRLNDDYKQWSISYCPPNRCFAVILRYRWHLADLRLTMRPPTHAAYMHSIRFIYLGGRYGTTFICVI